MEKTGSTPKLSLAATATDRDDESTTESSNEPVAKTIHSGWLYKGSDFLDTQRSRPRVWVELREDHKLHYFESDKPTEDDKIGVIVIPVGATLEKLDQSLLRSKSGFKIISSGGALSKVTFKFYAETADERDEWFTKISSSMAFTAVIHDEKSAEFFWGDFVSDPVVDIAWTGADESKKAVRLARHASKKNNLNQELVLFHRVVNKSYRPEDLVLMDEDHIDQYLPIFLQMPQLMDVLYGKLKHSHRLHEKAFWCSQAKLKLAAKFLNNTDFFRTSATMTNSFDFFSKRAAEFPLKKGQVWDDLDILDPVWNLGRVKTVEVTKVFASGHAPCLMKLTYHDPKTDSKNIMLKDDDVRSDMMVLIMFDVFNALWESSGLYLKPELITFKVVPAAPNFGFMEFVENSMPIRDFDFSTLAGLSEDDMEVFLSTAAAGYIGGFLLGIRDRHEDNLMVKDSHKFFQLDFKHAFNNKTFGIDGCRFAISNRFKTALEGRGVWQSFKMRTQAAYMVLRRNSQIIIQFSRALFKDLFPNAQIEKEMLHAFYLDRTEEQALARIDALIESGVVSLKRIMKNVTHELSGNIKPKQ